MIWFFYVLGMPSDARQGRLELEKRLKLVVVDTLNVNTGKHLIRPSVMPLPLLD